MQALKEGCEDNALNLNANKTKVLAFERNKEKTECKITVIKILEQVNEVVYLVSMVSRDGRYDMEAAGNMVNAVLASLMRWYNVSTASRLDVNTAVLVPTLLYGSKT